MERDELIEDGRNDGDDRLAVRHDGKYAAGVLDVSTKTRSACSGQDVAYKMFGM